MLLQLEWAGEVLLANSARERIPAPLAGVLFRSIPVVISGLIALWTAPVLPRNLPPLLLLRGPQQRLHASERVSEWKNEDQGVLLQSATLSHVDGARSRSQRPQRQRA